MNTAALYVLQGVNHLFPLAVIPYLLSTIGVPAFGKIVFTGSVVQLFVMVTEFGFNYTATARIASSPSDTAAVSAVFSTVLTTKAALTFASTIALAATVYSIPQLRPLWPLFLAQWPMLAGEALFPLWLFQGMQKLAFVTTFHVISRTTTLALLLLVVRTPNDVAWAAGIQAIHYPVAATAALITAYWRLGVRYQPSRRWHAYQDILRDSFKVFSGGLGSQLYARGPMVLVGFLGSEVLVASFAVAQRISSMLAMLVTPVSQSLYPHLCTLVATAPGRLPTLRRRFLLGILVGLSTSALLAALVTQPLLDAVAPGTDPSAFTMVWLYIPVVVLIGLNSACAIFALAVRAYHPFRRTVIVGAATFFLLAPFLTLRFDAYGMVLSSFAAELVVFAQCMYITRPSALLVASSSVLQDTESPA